MKIGRLIGNPYEEFGDSRFAPQTVNVQANPGKFGMEHLLEWHLIYRNEAGLSALLPEHATEPKIYVDATGVNVFAEVSIP